MADLEVRDLTVEFPSGGYIVRPLDSLSLAASTGELVILLGPSGSGKTTLLSCLAGILSPTSGTIAVAGQEVTSLGPKDLAEYRRRTVGIVFQAFNLIPSLTATENVAAPMRLSGTSSGEARERAETLLREMDLGDRLHHRPGNMSGGQQQRVAIARALVHDPPLLVADEPTAHLDHIQVETVLVLLRKLAAPGRLVVVATHDDRLLPLADRIVELAPKTHARHRPPERVEVAAGEVLFEQGSRGELVYVVEEGQIEIYRSRADGTEEHVAVIDPGGYFGELGPMLGLPRSASARGRTAAVLTAYTVFDFRRLFGIGDGQGPPGPSAARPRRSSRKAPARRRGPGGGAPRATRASRPARPVRRKSPKPS